MRSALLVLVIVGASSCALVPTTVRETRQTGAPPPAYVVTIAPATAAPGAAGTATPTSAANEAQAGRLEVTEYPVGKGQGPHDVAPAADGGVWYTAQRTGELGYLDPSTGATRTVKLGSGSAPHGVIVGPDGAAWVTDGGLNAIVRVDPKTNEVTRYTLPGRNANLNTATFDRDGTLWFTGQNGVFGRLEPRSGAVTVFEAPRGAGPYGIATCPDGNVYYASLAGSYIGRIVRATGESVVLTPPTSGQGSRRVWCDSKSRLWVSEWNVGKVARFDGTTWKEWKLPGVGPMTYAVYVDEEDVVWLTDFGANALVRFDPATETFTSLPHSAPNAAVRQLLGRPGEVWGAMSGQDKLLVVRTR
jgi:virginiamycin B lyase